MVDALEKQADVAGHVLGGIMRDAFARALDKELEQFRIDYIRKIDERLSDFRRKLLQNTTIRTDGGISLTERNVSVQFVMDMDQLRKECGL